MKKRLLIAIIILTIGFFIVPTSNYACEIKTEKSCCKKENTQNTKKDCCNDNNSKDKDNSCGGKCGHSNCTSTSPVNLSIISYFDIEFKNINIDYYTKKSNFYYTKTFISSGFTSVWLPPNIK